MNIITVKINGMEYNIRGEENDAYLHMVASFVDKKISDLLESNSRIGRADATILAALNLGDEVFKKKELYERATENLKQTLNDQRDLMSQLGSMKNTIEDLRKENEELKEKLTNVESKEIVEKAKDELENSREQIKIMDEMIRELKDEINQSKIAINNYEECEAALKRKVQILKEERIKQVSLNKKLLSSNNDWRYKDIEKTRKIEHLTKELENKNCELIKVNNKNSVLKKIKV